MLFNKIYAVFIVLFVSISLNKVQAQTVKECDEIIQKGVNALYRQDYVKSLEYLMEARSMAEKNHWHRQLFLANNNIGGNYHSMLLYGEALDYYLQSYSIAVKYLEPKEEMTVLNNIAIIHSKEKNYEKAKNYFKKAYDIALENKEYLKAGIYDLNLGSLANETNDLAEARNYFTEALNYVKNEPDMVLMAELGLADNDLLAGNSKKALEKAEKLYNGKYNLTYNSSGSLLLLLMTRAHIELKEYNKALQTANKVLAAKPNEEIKKNAFELLSLAYSKNGRLNQALQFKDSVIASIARIEEAKNSTLLKNNEVKFELLNYKNELAIKEEKSRADQKLFYYVLAVCIGVAMIIVLTLLNILSKHKQKKLIAERNEKNIALELEKEKNENLVLEKQIREKEINSQLEQQHLKNELEERNRKLSAKALYLHNRNLIIEDVITGLHRIPELQKNSALENLIKTLKGQLRSDDEWESFLTHFEEVNHGFITHIKTLHPSLTANDIRFISYIYMNMNTKEIANLLSITDDACRKRKERITAKMGLPENTSLYSYLSNIQSVSH